MPATPAEMERIAQALASACDALDSIVDERDRVLPRKLRKNAHAAWIKAVRVRFARPIADLRNAQHYDQIARDLETHGLSGVELKMKLDAFDRALARFNERGFWDLPQHIILKIIKSLLGWLNKWLESLEMVLTTLGPIIEFKGHIEQAIDDVLSGIGDD